ncbi:MAG TPA: hypothetical protein VMM56_08930 [Planctomycetaceae bacterium]|nr:hypothetical protein [Planctomycetaceae bacterium]
MIVSRSYRLKIALLCLFTVSGFMTSEAHSAEKISDKFDVEVSALRKARARDQFQVDVTLKNKSDAAISGRIVLAVKGTSVRGLVLTEPDGHLPGGLAFLEVITAKESLKAGEEKSLKGVSFDSSPLLKSDELEKFDLQTEVYQTTEKTGPVNSKENPSVRGNSGVRNIPLAGTTGQSNSGKPSGNTGSEKPSNELKPTPDPAFTEPEGDVEGTGQKSTPGGLKRPRLPTDEEVAIATKAKGEWREKLFDVEGVHGLGVGWGKDGSAVIHVQVEKFADKKLVPATVDGVNVEVYVAEQPRLFQFGQFPDDFDDGNRARGGVFTPVPGCFDSPRMFHPRPSPIGVSGWNVKLQLCATGTLGCRLKDPTGQHYVLSNSHVLADYGFRSAAGQAVLGDPVIQPGPIDLNCAVASDSVLGGLAAFTPLSFTTANRLDAAIALTSASFFGSATPCDGYGLPSERILPATIGSQVMKYGRTTGFTVGNVISIDFDFNLLVDPIAGTTAPFQDQVLILSDFNYGFFGQPGDSGSLIVNRDGRNPVALLFAGGGPFTIGNHIDEVLFDMGFRVGFPFGGLTIDGEPAPVPVP